MSNNTDLLQPPPKRARGVRRLNNWPTWIAGGMIGIAVAATGWNYEHRAAQTQKVTEQANKDPLPSDGTSLDSLIRDHNVQPVILGPRKSLRPRHPLCRHQRCSRRRAASRRPMLPNRLGGRRG